MTDKQTVRGRRLFLVLAVLFFAPVVAAYLFYFAFPEWQPAGKTHHGILLDPARPLPELVLRDAQGKLLDGEVLRRKWTLLYLGGATCDKSCQDSIFEIRQIRTLLNQNRDRVQRVYVAPDGQALASARQTLTDEVHPDLVYLDGAESGLAAFLQPKDANAIYLIDPLGNWLMVYPAQTAYQGILSDLKKLLRLSQIG